MTALAPPSEGGRTASPKLLVCCRSDDAWRALSLSLGDGFRLHRAIDLEHMSAELAVETPQILFVALPLDEAKALLASVPPPDAASSPVRLLWRLDASGPEPTEALTGLFWHFRDLPAPAELRRIVAAAAAHHEARSQRGGPPSLQSIRDLRALRRLAMFDGLPDEVLEDVAHRLKHHRRRRGERLFSQGDSGNSMFLLASGQARVLVRDESGQEQVLTHLVPGDVMGEIALLLDQPRSASIEMTIDGDLLELEREELLAFLSAHPRAALQLSRHLASRLIRPRTPRKDSDLRLLATHSKEVALGLVQRISRLGGQVAVLNLASPLSAHQAAPLALLEELEHASEETLTRRLSDLLALFERVMMILPEGESPAARKALELADTWIVTPWQHRALPESASSAARTLRCNLEPVQLDRTARAIVGRRVGLVMSSGGAWGLAHVGVLKALVEEGLPIDYVAGASAGALVGALHCSGWSPADLVSFAREEIPRALSMRAGYFDPAWRPWRGLLSGKKARAWLDLHLKGVTFSELETPLCVAVSDLTASSERILDEGTVADAVRASISVPGVFRPWMWRGNALVDGGMINPLPVSALVEREVNLVVASSVVGAGGGLPPGTGAPSFMQQMLSLMGAMEKETLKVRRPQVDLLLRPEVGHRTLLGYAHADELIALGEASVRAQLPALRALVAKTRLDPP